MSAPLSPAQLEAITRLDREQRLELIELLEERQRREAQRLFYRLYPEEDTPWTGPSIMGGLMQPGQVIYARHKYPKHMEFLAAGAKYRERCMMAANRIGKALRHGTPVATPEGWRVIEDLRVGDQVFAGDGTVTTVTGVFPQGVKPLFRLTFDVGETIDCCADHLWVYQHPRARYPYRRSHKKTEPNPFFGEWRVADTQTILNEVGEAPIPRRRVVMPTSKPWQFEEKPVAVDPYLAGLLLGDGMLKHNRIGFSSADEEILQAVRDALPEGCELRHLGRHDYGIISTCERQFAVGGGYGRSHPLMIPLIQMGMYGNGGGEKHVPREYLLNAPAVRLAVLQGLMDSDGSISRTGAMEFTSISRRLAEDVAFLVHSLGGKAAISDRQTHYTHKGERRAGKPSYRVRIRLNACPFRLARKADRWTPRHNTPNRVLHRIDPIEPGEATCISVAHPDRTYVTAHGIVTHNTFSVGGFETACHLTGLYPDWWEGKRFEQPISAWAAGDTYETTRDILQLTLLGEVAWDGARKVMDGRGIIPGELLGGCTWRSGVQNLVDTIEIRHVTGGVSKLALKSYDQGRKAFQGTGRQVIWLDEEPPMDVYNECLIRTATTGGIILLTFTPLSGLSEVVLSFLPQDQRPAEAA